MRGKGRKENEFFFSQLSRQENSKKTQKKNSKNTHKNNAPPAAASAASSLRPATRILCRDGLDLSRDSSEERSPPSRWEASSVVAAVAVDAFARENCGGSGGSVVDAPAVAPAARAGGGSAEALAFAARLPS